MLEMLIADVEKALETDCYFAALALALTLPDICGRAQYPGNGVGNRYRYIKWYDEHVGRTEQSPYKDPPMPYLSGEVVYTLRNHLLHQGTPNIDSTIKEDRNNISHFEIVIESKKLSNPYGDAAGIQHDGSRTYRVNVRRLCFILCSCAKGYYNDNKDKFDFFAYTIIDWDKEVKKCLVL